MALHDMTCHAMPCHDMALHCHVPAPGMRSRPSTPHRCSTACCGACRRSRACAGSTAAWRRGRTMSSSIPSPPSTPSRRDLPAHSATGDEPGWTYMPRPMPRPKHSAPTEPAKFRSFPAHRNRTLVPLWSRSSAKNTNRGGRCFDHTTTPAEVKRGCALAPARAGRYQGFRGCGFV